MLLRRSLWVAATGLLSWAGSAAALQFTPSATARLHTFGSGQPGSEFNTQGLAVGGQISYNSGTQTLSMTGVVDTMNWFDPLNGLCPTDVGSNCSLNFSPDLDVTFTASLDSIVPTSLGGPFFLIQVNFKTAPGVDFVVTDPLDIGYGPVLKGNIQAGSFGGNPTTGLAASVVWDTSLNGGLGGVVGGLKIVNSTAFLTADPSTLYASLFLSDYFGLAFATVTDFNNGAAGALDSIVGIAFSTGVLPSFTAEVNGQVLNLAAGSFVPEPSTLLLLGPALPVLARLRRRQRG